MSMGLQVTDLHVRAFAGVRLVGLPPGNDLFDADTAKANSGFVPFAGTCADCHQPNTAQLGRDIGTRPARSRMIRDPLKRQTP
jgi:mono/diheme cytochrome c family protein